jgi:DNA-binding GntR family transcriptional regulator
MADDAPIARAVLSDAVKDLLLRRILDGTYPPGSRIVETRAAREFGTSQAPVREALRDLEALGLVEISAFRGARVRRPSRAELAEAFVVRAELEVLAIRPLVGQLTDEDVAHLRGLLREMHEGAARGDIQADANADAAFHGYLVARAGNATLERVWHLLEPHSRTYITLAASGPDRARIADAHVSILDAMLAGDPDEAEATLREHFADAQSVIERGWPEDGPVPDAIQPPAPAAPAGAAANT